MKMTLAILPALMLASCGNPSPEQCRMNGNAATFTGDSIVYQTDNLVMDYTIQLFNDISTNAE